MKYWLEGILTENIQILSSSFVPRSPDPNTLASASMGTSHKPRNQDWVTM